MRRTILAALVGAIALMGCPSYAERAPSREPSVTRGSCDGLLDYATELLPSQVSVVRQTDLGGGLVEVELSMELLNQQRGHFRSASAFPKIEEGNALGILTNPPPIAAEFGAIDPYGTAASVATLQLQLPAANVSDLIAQIEDGSLPATVHADEEPVFAPGIKFRNWSQLWDGHFSGWPLNFASASLYGPDHEPPYEPGAIYEVYFPTLSVSTDIPDTPPLYAGDLGDGFGPLDLSEICTAVDPQSGACTFTGPGESLYLTPGDDRLYYIPRSMHYVRVLAIFFDEVLIDGGVEPAIFMRVQRTDQDSIPQLVESGSFCTGTAHQIDPPVAATRVPELDGDTVDPETRDGNGQQIRFNFLPYWAEGRLSLSGQIGCHVLKPRVALRIRDGHVETESGLDTDCSMTAEMRAYDHVEVGEEQDPIELWRTCFPLPSLPVGGVSIPMTFQIVHSLDVSASASAGAVVGFTKHWDGGFSIACEGGPGVAETCTSESHREPTPIEFTPPQLTHQTAASVQAKTTLEAALRMGFEHPFCDLGAGVFLESNAYATLSATPTLDPWWRTTFGLDLTGGLDFGIFGLGLARFDTELFAIEEQIDAGGPLLGGVLGGQSARSAALGSDDTPLVSGADQRWAVAIDDTLVPNGVDTTAIAALPDGSTFTITSESTGNRSALVKLDRFGAFQWAQRYGDPKRARRVRVLPDGTAVVGASPAYIGRHDADGDLLFSSDATISRPHTASATCQLRDLVAIEQGPGEYDYVVVGRMGATAAMSNDACAFRVNADGSIPWAKIYGEEDVQEFLGATATSDGAIAAVGLAHGFISGNRLFPLIAKLDSATGDVIWWRGLPMTRLAKLNSVAEGPDGTLFAVGGAQRIVWQTGAALVARIDADGTNARHGLLFQDELWEELFDFEQWVNTVAGETAYDEFFDIAPQGDGFVIAGRTGLGTNTEAWAAKINQKFGLEWYRTFDGSSTDSLGGVAPATDGVFVSGYSSSLPQPDGPNTGENQLWVMKLPFTGAVEFLPNAGVTTRYVQPGVRFSSDDPAVSGGADGTVGTSAFTVTDAVVEAAGPDPSVVAPVSTYCAVLLTESGRASTLDACIEDGDLDGIADDADNCIDVWNEDQLDSDADDFGNACDADLDQSGTVDEADRVLLTASFGLASNEDGFNADADLDGDGVVGIVDFAILRALQGGAPGDSFQLPAPGPFDAPLVELIFPATGTNEVEVQPGALVAVQIRITPGISGISAYSLSLDFGDGLDFDAASELLPEGFDLELVPGVEVVDSEPGVDGSVHSCDASAHARGAVGDAFVACELSFVATSGAGLAAGLRAGVDGIRSGTGADLSEVVALVPATIEVPEPGRLASGIAALTALALTHRRRGRSH